MNHLPYGVGCHTVFVLRLLYEYGSPCLVLLTSGFVDNLRSQMFKRFRQNAHTSSQLLHAWNLLVLDLVPELALGDP